MTESTLKRDSISSIMSRALSPWLLAVFAVEATVLVVGGVLHHGWTGAVLLAAAAVIWVVDIYIGRWMTRRPEVVAQRMRFSLAAFAFMIGLYIVPWMLSWSTSGAK
jgi:hypothetical protein